MNDILEARRKKISQEYSDLKDELLKADQAFHSKLTMKQFRKLMHKERTIELIKTVTKSKKTLKLAERYCDLQFKVRVCHEEYDSILDQISLEEVS